LLQNRSRVATQQKHRRVEDDCQSACSQDHSNDSKGRMPHQGDRRSNGHGVETLVATSILQACPRLFANHA
jgi:hypothetical protein